MDETVIAGLDLLKVMRQQLDRIGIGQIADPWPQHRLRMAGEDLVLQLPRRLGRGVEGKIDGIALIDELMDDRRTDSPGTAGNEDASGADARRHQAASRLRTRLTFCPPKPKEFDNMKATSARRAALDRKSTRLNSSN